MGLFILLGSVRHVVARPCAYNFGAQVPGAVTVPTVMPAVHTHFAASQEAFEPPAAPLFNPQETAELPAPLMQETVLQLAMPAAMPVRAAPAVATTTTTIMMMRRIWRPNWMHDPLAQ